MSSLTSDLQPVRDVAAMSKIDPEFLVEQEQCDKDSAALWAMSLEGMRTQYRDYPPTVPKGTPQPGIDIEITHRMVPVRDESEVEIRCYKKINKTLANALFFLVSHGGGGCFSP